MSITKYGTSTANIAKTASDRPTERPNTGPENQTTLPIRAMSQAEAERIQAELKKKEQ